MRFVATKGHERDALEEYGALGWDRRSYLARLGDAVSQLANTLLGGMPDESLSGRSYRICILQEGRAPWRWRAVRRAAELLFFWDDGNHTQLAFWNDVFRSRARGRAVELFAQAVSLQTWDGGGSLHPQPVNQSDEE